MDTSGLDERVDVAAAQRFLASEARLVERRLYATLFEHAPADGVVDALRGYQNPDGGFGHALEPDKRCPDSLPIDVLVALRTMASAGTVDRRMVRRAGDWLASVAGPSGAVPLAFPVIEAYPRAAHWADWTYRPGLFPTAGLAGMLHAVEVEHAWRTAATSYCWSALRDDLPDDAHALADVLTFLAHAPDRDRAERLAPAVVAALPTASSYRSDPDDPAYGLTPLDIVPSPASHWRRLFDDADISAHLARLARDQQPDGGWPLTWEPPSRAAVLEWRGVQTLAALRVLRAYGAVPVPDPGDGG